MANEENEMSVIRLTRHDPPGDRPTTIVLPDSARRSGRLVLSRRQASALGDMLQIPGDPHTIKEAPDAE